MTHQTEHAIIGRNALITVSGITGVPAKVDTGADSSSVWATDIREANGSLHFILFGVGSKYYTGQEIVAEAGTYYQARIASSSGTRQTRWVVTLPVGVEGKQLEMQFTLADRVTMSYPVLLGRSFLAGQFVVDVTKQIADDIHNTLIADKHARRRAAAEDKE